MKNKDKIERGTRENRNNQRKRVSRREIGWKKRGFKGEKQRGVGLGGGRVVDMENGE